MNDEIINELEKVLNSTGYSIKQAEQFYPKITELLMPLSITGISPRTYFHWKKTGLIPIELSNQQEREWVRLNLIDYVWLKIIQIMRDFGIPLKVIKEAKEMLFMNLIKTIIENKDDYFTLLETETKVEKEKIAALKKIIELLGEELNNVPEELEIYFTTIGIMISDLLLKNDRGSIIITKNKNEFEINYFSYKNMENAKHLFSSLLELPHFQIPIRKLIEDFFDDPKSEKFVDSFELLNLKEKKVIDAIRKKDFKEIVIKQDKKESIIIELEKDGDIMDQKARDVKRILGLNEYSEVTIKFRNDKHMYFKNKTRL